MIGVYGDGTDFFPVGQAMNKNLSVHMGNCNHRRYIPELVRMTAAGVFDPSEVLTQHEPLANAIEAFEAFDRRETGWVKVAFEV